MSKRAASLAAAIFLLIMTFWLNAGRAPAAPASAARSLRGSSLPEELIVEPDQGIAPIIGLLKSASTSVDLVMYQLEDPLIEAALAEDASRGVAVRVLLNEGYYGKKENGDNDSARAYLQAHGIEVRATPSYFALTHEKSAVIDGSKLLIMTLNFTPQYYSSSRDFALLDTDRADAEAAQSAFESDWGGQRIAASGGDSLIWSPGAREELLSIIRSATSSLFIYNEEMQDARIETALEDAASRGVAVRVAMTDQKEWHAAFGKLSQAGVRIRLFAGEKPLYVHAKVVDADDSVAFLGSENFSASSLDKNRELGSISADQDVLRTLKKTFDSDWTIAKPFR